MKTLKTMLVIFTISAFVACKESKDETKVIEKTTVIEKEVEVPAPEKPEKEDGTSFSIDEDGVEFSNKKGENSTEIKVNEKKKSVKIEKLYPDFCK